MSSVVKRDLYKLTVAPISSDSYLSWFIEMEKLLLGKGLGKFVGERTTKPGDRRVESPSSE